MRKREGRSHPNREAEGAGEGRDAAVERGAGLEAAEAPAAPPALTEAESSAPVRVTGRPFPKGVSGNPGGRPKVIEGVKRDLEGGAPGAAARLVALIAHKDPKIALAACTAVLDRVIGKPRETVSVQSNTAALILLELAQRRRDEDGPVEKVTP